MICLDNTDTLEGGASVGNVVDYSVYGLAAPGVFKRIASGKLSSTDPTVLYTCATATGVSIVSVVYVNTHSAAVTVNLYMDPLNAGTPIRQIPKNLSLGIGYSMHTDGAKFQVCDPTGAVVTTGSVSDEAYNATTWDGVTAIAPSKNAVRDEFENRISKTLFDAQTILAAVNDDTPVAVAIAVQQVIGRLTGGNIKGLSATELTALLNAATTSLQGPALLATNAEALTGADTGKIVTPDDLRYVLNRYQPRENLIGIPGMEGFGVGICPLANLPTGMTPMSGCFILGDDNYGNYQFQDGSVMCWIPAFYYRIAHAGNPTYGTYGVNSIDIKSTHDFAGREVAEAAGYALHRAFIDGGVEKSGFFVDKYKCSKVANGAGFTAASIKNGLPLSTAAAHNPFSDLTGGANYYYSAIDLAHRRDGVDGAVNASSIFFCCSQFVRAALAMLSLAHGQAATSTVNCAWYHATYNYPKGCNNDALRDADDTTVIWESDGYSNCGKTGSAGYGGGAGNVFAKSTHNGQNCGVADLNGLMYEISIGVTCDGTYFYVAKQATAMKAFTHGESGATDHWGSTGIAAMMDALTVPFISGNDGWIYFGNGANQVLAEELSGNSWLLTGLGFPDSADGLSAAGTNLFGKDGLYRYIINKLCLLACFYWSDASYAGVWSAPWSPVRDYSGDGVGFRAACYPV